MSNIKDLDNPVIREWLGLLAFIGGLVFCAVQWEWLWRIDQTLYDDALTLIERPADSDIVIIGIDEQSLAKFGRWPWPRSTHAVLMDKLSNIGVKAVLFDIILSEPDLRDSAGDKLLAAAILANGKVVLPVAVDPSDGINQGEAKPSGEYAAAAARLAHAGPELDPDGILRSVYLRGGSGTARYDLLSLAGLVVAEPQKWQGGMALPGRANLGVNSRPGKWVRDYWFQIPFVGPPGTYRIISYWDAIRNDSSDASLRGKIVLVGATAPSLTDEYPTPVSGHSSRAMSGVEVHANVLQGLREGIDIRIISRAQLGFITMIIVVLAMVALLKLDPRTSSLFVLSSAIVVAVVSAALFKFAYVWYSPALTFAALLITYPLWSWRKLEVAQRYFDEELSRLKGEAIIVPEEAASVISPLPSNLKLRSDFLGNRILALQSASQRIRTLNRFVSNSLDSLPEAVLVTDAMAVVMLTNSSANRLLRSHMEDSVSIEGQILWDLLATFKHDGSKSWKNIWHDAYDETQVVSLETVWQDDREFLIRIAPLFSARGVQTGTIVGIIDISPLRETERRRDEALRFLSHDMRSPQASILTLLDMYREDQTSMSVEKLTSRVERYARRTLALADDFLQLAKAERARSQEFKPVEIIEVLQDAADGMWAAAKAKEIRIVIDNAVEEAWMQGDRDLLTRAVLNLISNAIKYSPPDTQITLRVKKAGDSWVLNVEDQGFGITKDDISRLFTRFARLKHEGQPEEAGIGLGLVFVKTVTLRHGGTIDVSSHVASAGDPKQGTIFILSLPAMPRPEG